MIKHLLPYAICLVPNLAAFLFMHIFHPRSQGGRWLQLCVSTFLHFVGFWFAVVLSLMAYQMNHGFIMSDLVALYAVYLTAGLLAVSTTFGLDLWKNPGEGPELSAMLTGVAFGIVLFLCIYLYGGTPEENTVGIKVLPVAAISSSTLIVG